MHARVYGITPWRMADLTPGEMAAIARDAEEVNKWQPARSK